jgi:hypothetical protein
VAPGHILSFFAKFSRTASKPESLVEDGWHLFSFNGAAKI